MIRVDRVNDGSGWSAQEVDITNEFQAIFDLRNILVGWAYYGPNGPQRVMARYPDEPTPTRPSDTDDKGKPLYKAGFSLKMVLGKSCGGGLREFGSNAATVVDALGALHDTFAAAPEAGQGMLPIVRLAGVTPERGEFGTNYRPRFEVVTWADRPVELQTNGNGAAKPGVGSAPIHRVAPSTGATIKAPPVQAAQPAPAAEDDFG